MQSLNLRAALFRCLEQVKKTGLLGRDAVLRKSTLDECKGERLEELLAVFSTAVLKMSETCREQDDAIAQKLAMEKFSYTGDRTPISTLILAHKVSLSRILTAKNIAKLNYNDFASLLRLKDRQIARRHEQLKASIEENGSWDETSDEEFKGLQDRVRRSWTGNNKYLEAILYGDNRYERDEVLAISFDDIWEHVEDASVGDIEERNRKGLLEELDARVMDQNNRLEKWRGFEQALLKGSNPRLEEEPSEPGKEAKGIDFGFGAHEALQLSSSPKKAGEAISRAPLEEYTRLWKKLQAELTNVGKSRNGETDAKRNEIAMKKQSSAFEPPRDLLYDTRSTTLSINPEQHSPEFEDYTIKSTSKTLHPELSLTRSDLFATKSLEPRCEDEDPIELHPSAAPSRSVSAYSEMPPPSPPSPNTSSEAFDILAAVPNSSPSPKKPRHLLSLAERTRLSMSHMSKANSHAHLGDLDDISEILPPPQSLKPATQSSQFQSTSSSSSYSDLSARTRQSLSNSAPALEFAKFERRRAHKAAASAKRASYLPAKPLEMTLASDADGLSRKLFEEADYDAVFKSRPKIKTSPDMSPVKAWGGMGSLAGKNLEDGSSSPAPASP